MDVICNRCQQDLTKPGALLFSPPNQGSKVMKLHLCIKCYGIVMSSIQDIELRTSRPADEIGRRTR